MKTKGNYRERVAALIARALQGPCTMEDYRAAVDYSMGEQYLIDWRDALIGAGVLEYTGRNWQNRKVFAPTAQYAKK